MRRLLAVSRSSGEISTVRISPIAMTSMNNGLAAGCAAAGWVAGWLVAVVGVWLVPTVAIGPAVGPGLGTGPCCRLRLATLVRSNRV
jgi:hypothetical protein